MFLPASVAQVTGTQCAPYRRSWGSIPGSTGRFRVWVLAFGLISRAAKRVPRCPL